MRYGNLILTEETHRRGHYLHVDDEITMQMAIRYHFEKQKVGIPKYNPQRGKKQETELSQFERELMAIKC